MDDMAKMIGSILSDDKEAFTSAFNAEMDTRVGEVIVNKNLDISKDMMTPTEEPVEEAYTFKSPAEAKKFVTSASNAGLTKRNFKIKGKTVDVSGVKDKEMNQMLQMLAKEMKAK